MTDAMDVLDDALEILKALLQGEEVSKTKNVFLYEKYRYHSRVEEMLYHVTGKLELKVYAGQDRLFICPEVGSRLFGWSNEGRAAGQDQLYHNEQRIVYRIFHHHDVGDPVLP